MSARTTYQVEIHCTDPACEATHPFEAVPDGLQLTAALQHADRTGHSIRHVQTVTSVTEIGGHPLLPPCPKCGVQAGEPCISGGYLPTGVLPGDPLETVDGTPRTHRGRRSGKGQQ